MPGRILGLKQCHIKEISLSQDYGHPEYSTNLYLVTSWKSSHGTILYHNNIITKTLEIHFKPVLQTGII
jgi:hypothetical protein